MHSIGLVSLSGIHALAARIVCVILTSLRVSQVSCFTSQQPQMLPFCPKRLSQMWGSHPWVRSSAAHSSPLFHSLFCLIKSCINLYIPFQLSGAPSSSQLVLCKIFCIWRYIPDSSMERDVLLIHILLCHLVSLHSGRLYYCTTSTDHLDRKPIS